MSSWSVSEWGYVMSDLKRKYDGLKQAHKELSVEVVGLREKVDELEDDIQTSIGILRTADKLCGLAIAERDRYKSPLEVFANSICVKELADVSEEHCPHCIATDALKEST